MTIRRIYYTPGSPFGRAVRIIATELGLEFEPELANIKDTPEDRARRSATLQVPTLFDGDVVLWDSSLIADYLLKTYGASANRSGDPPLGRTIARDENYWEDQRLFATIQTLGESTVLVSQMRWSGITAREIAHVARNVGRILHLIGWLEEQLPSSDGFRPGELSVQDIFAVCHIMFITHRPLEIEWDRAATPKLAALHDRLKERESFLRHPIEWWQPGLPT